METDEDIKNGRQVLVQCSVGYDSQNQLGTMLGGSEYVTAQSMAGDMMPSPYVIQSGAVHDSTASASNVQYVLQEQGDATSLTLVTDEQQVLRSELIPGATLPTEFLQLSSDHSIQETDKQKKEIHIGDVFASASASLTEAFIDYLTLTHDPTYLESIAQQFDLILHQSAESLSYHGKIDSLQKLERHFLQLLFGPTLPENSVCQETQTDNTIGDANSTEDKSVMCDIPRPLFSRSGRQLKIKSELYENESIDDATFEPRTSLQTIEATKPKSQDKPSEQTGTGRKRGRPPKKKPKMIHVAEGTKKVTVRDSATGNVIIAETGDVVKQTETIPTPLVETQDNVNVTTDDVNIKNDESGAEEEASVIPEEHQRFISRIIETAESQETTTEKDKERSIKKEYEEKMPFKYYCDICSFKTKRKSHLDKHKEIHKHKKLPLLHCDLCSFTTMRSGHLSRHLLKHSDNIISCHQCNYKTINGIHMRTHMKKKHQAELDAINENVQVLTCEICGYKTKKETVMKRHLRIHDDGTALVPIFECRQCPYKTLKKVHYSRHLIDVHSEKRPYLCDTCGRGFKRNDALRQHRQVHLDKAARTYPYTCEDCGKGFRTPAHLKEHMTIHSTLRPYLCDICGACFKTKSVQRKHQATLHANPRAHQCPLCQRRFNTAFTLRRHLKMHGEDDNAAEAITPALTILQQEEGIVYEDEAHNQQAQVEIQTQPGQEIVMDGNVVGNIVVNDIQQQHVAHKPQEYAIETQPIGDKNSHVQMQVIGSADGGIVTTTTTTGSTTILDDQIVQMIPESLYLQQGSTVQIVTQNEMGGVEQVQMVMIQPGADGTTQIIDAGQNTDTETLLYLTSLPQMQTGIEETG